MVLIRKIRAVWVPFNVSSVDERITNVANDIPRFLHPEECKDFIQLNAVRLGRRKIQFQERFEPEFRDEFSKGVGRDSIPPWYYGPPHDPETTPVNRRSLRDYD